jgi:hypothetical protein
VEFSEEANKPTSKIAVLGILAGLFGLPVKCLLPTRNELGWHLNPDEKDVFGVNQKALAFWQKA